MDERIKEKIKATKSLQGMSVFDVCMLDRFMDNLAGYMKAQRDDRNAVRNSYKLMKASGGPKSYRLPAHPLDRIIDWTDEIIRDEFVEIVRMRSNLPSALRKYVEQVGLQAYSLTVAQLVCEEFPELEQELIPPSEKN